MTGLCGGLAERGPRFEGLYTVVLASGSREDVAARQSVALFFGPSGIGKTFAVALLATLRDLPLDRVDLGSLVRKYFGETEKNLSRFFDTPYYRPIVLLFDGVGACSSGGER